MNEKKTTKNFTEALKKLNPKQKEAVETIDGPVMVIAGPGTGKTQILSVRIANILYQTDTDPESILAITFTESGVTEMKSRLSYLMGKVGMDVSVHTFHGLANEIILSNPDIFPHLAGSKQISDIERIDILEKIITSLDVELLKPLGDPFFYLSAISRAIDDLKREGIDPDKYREMTEKEFSFFNKIEDLYYSSGKYLGKMKGKYQTEEKKIKKNIELVEVFTKYQEELRKSKRYDYSDMIIEFKEVLEKNNDFRLILQEKYQYLLIDEHQDTNFAQNKIVELLADFFDKPNLFVVGDEKQAIFRFQGASLQNFYYFKDRYPLAKLIILEDNYRSNQNILDTAHKLFPDSVKLFANNLTNEKPINLAIFQNQDIESVAVARRILELLSDGIKPKEIAVIYRNNKDATILSHWFDRLQVPYLVDTRQGLLENYFVKQILDIVRLISDPKDSSLLAKIMHFPCFSLEPVSVFRIINSYYRHGQNINLAEFLLKDNFFEEYIGTNFKKISVIDENQKNLKEVSENDYKKKWLEFLSFLKKVISDFQHQKPQDSIRSILSDSGLIKQVVSSDNSKTNLETINVFLKEADSFFSDSSKVCIVDIISYFDLAQKHRLSLGQKNKNKDDSKVRLMTAHSSKGQEFQYVFIVFADNNHFGNKKRAEILPLLSAVYKIIDIKEELSESILEDERRLFYVAMTRSKNGLWISYSNKNKEEKEMLPSLFIEELEQNTFNIVDTTFDEEFFNSNQVLWYEKKSQAKNTILETDYIRNLFLEQGLSVTALNNYLKSPWTYFFRNLVRLPEPKTNMSLFFGTAMHFAMQSFFEKIKKGEKQTVDDLVNYFLIGIEKAPFSSHSEKKRYLKRGQESLTGWFENYNKDFKVDLINEMNISVFLTDEIKLTGKIDKIEMINDSDCVVVDYKTGKPKTRNEIIGNTKQSDGDYYRQLVFYKILLKHYKNSRFNMVKGDLDFLEPDSKGVFHKESFEISQEEVDDLEKLIIQVSREIISGEFLQRPCDPDKCDYCDIKNYLFNDR